MPSLMIFLHTSGLTNFNVFFKLLYRAKTLQMRGVPPRVQAQASPDGTQEAAHR